MQNAKHELPLLRLYDLFLDRFFFTDNLFEVSRTSLELTRSVFPAFLSELRHAGWITSHVLLGADEWRASWRSDKNAHGEGSKENDS